MQVIPITANGGTAPEESTASAPLQIAANRTHDALPFARTLDNIATSPSHRAEARHSGAYAVRNGDTLWHICREGLTARGDSPSDAEVHQAVSQVARANGLRNPDLIMPGQRLDLSALTSPMSSHRLGQDTPSLRSYRVSAVVPRTAPPTPPRHARSSQEAVTDFGVTKSFDINGLLDSLLRPEPLAEVDTVASGPWADILEGPARLTSPFGMRRDPFTRRTAHHDGIDLAAEPGTGVSAVLPGEVVFSGWQPGYGKVVIVRHDDGLDTVYAHNAKNLVHVGDAVTEDTLLARVGSTGRSTGPHLHFEARQAGRPVNPIPLLQRTPSFNIAQAP